MPKEHYQTWRTIENGPRCELHVRTSVADGFKPQRPPQCGSISTRSSKRLTASAALRPTHVRSSDKTIASDEVSRRSPTKTSRTVSWAPGGSNVFKVETQKMPRIRSARLFFQSKWWHFDTNSTQLLQILTVLHMKKTMIPVPPQHFASIWENKHMFQTARKEHTSRRRNFSVTKPSRSRLKNGGRSRSARTGSNHVQKSQKISRNARTVGVSCQACLHYLLMLHGILFPHAWLLSCPFAHI